MKQIIISTSIFCLLLLQSLSAQTNLNFENWNGNDPTGWTSSNSMTQANGGAQTTFKETTSPGQGSASVKLVTGSCPDCPNFSIIGIAMPLPDPLGGSIQLGSYSSPGIAYTQRPVSVDFKYKSNPSAGDACGFHVELTRYNSVKDEDETIGEGYFESNSKVTNWTNMNIPIVYYSSLQPDKINMFATSSIGSIPDLSGLGLPSPSQLGLPKPVSGSEFYLDAIVLNLPSCAGFTLSISGTKETSLGANDGTASVTANGGATPYTYLWNTNATSQSINGLVPGYYSVTVIDANQCVKVANYFVAPGGCNLSLAMSGTNSNSNSIFSGTGSVTATPSGGNPPYKYTWNTGATGQTISNLAIGTYAVLVEEQNNPNCAMWGFYTITGPTNAGVKELSLDNTLIIYPNPSNGTFSLKSDNNISTVEVVNVLGEKVLVESINANQGLIDLSKQANGVYFLSVVSNGRVTAIKKLVVNH